MWRSRNNKKKLSFFMVKLQRCYIIIYVWVKLKLIMEFPRSIDKYLHKVCLYNVFKYMYIYRYNKINSIQLKYFNITPVSNYLMFLEKQQNIHFLTFKNIYKQCKMVL